MSLPSTLNSSMAVQLLSDLGTLVRRLYLPKIVAVTYFTLTLWLWLSTFRNCHIYDSFVSNQAPEPSKLYLVWNLFPMSLASKNFFVYSKFPKQQCWLLIVIYSKTLMPATSNQRISWLHLNAYLRPRRVRRRRLPIDSGISSSSLCCRSSELSSTHLPMAAFENNTHRTHEHNQ